MTLLAEAFPGIKPVSTGAMPDSLILGAWMNLSCPADGIRGAKLQRRSFVALWLCERIIAAAWGLRLLAEAFPGIKPVSTGAMPDSLILGLGSTTLVLRMRS